MSKPGDLKPEPFPALDWTSGNHAKAVGQLADYVTAHATTSVDWYFSRKGSKELGGTTLRVAAILMTAVAGVIPILAEIWQTGGVPKITPGWSAFALALAALFVALDKFWGFTSAWVRYVQAGQALSERLDTFRLDVAAVRSNWSGEPTGEQRQAAVQLCRELLLHVHAAVRAETNQWAAEFQGALVQIDEASNGAAKHEWLGGIDVVVENGDQCDAGWTLRVGNGAPLPQQGKSAALARLTPTIHELAVEGTIAGASKHASRSVSVVAGQVVPVSFTLE